MEPCSYQLCLAEVETGIMLDAQGNYWARGMATFQPRFPTRAAALATKDELLCRFPFAEAWLTDLDAAAEPECFFDEAALAQYLAAIRTWRAWQYGSWLQRLCTPEPVDPRAACK